MHMTIGHTDGRGVSTDETIDALLLMVGAPRGQGTRTVAACGAAAGMRTGSSPTGAVTAGTPRTGDWGRRLVTSSGLAGNIRHHAGGVVPSPRSRSWRPLARPSASGASR